MSIKKSLPLGDRLLLHYSYTDVQTVVNTIVNHPNKELRRSVNIGTVSTCVNPHNVYLYGYRTIPGLLQQCSRGWVNNVILTGSSDDGVCLPSLLS